VILNPRLAPVLVFAELLPRAPLIFLTLAPVRDALLLDRESRRLDHYVRRGWHGSDETHRASGHKGSKNSAHDFFSAVAVPG
jgi:hypothetical protein